MKFVNNVNVALAWKVDVQEVTDSMNNHELTGEWGVYASFITMDSYSLTVLIDKFSNEEDAISFKKEVQR